MAHDHLLTPSDPELHNASTPEDYQRAQERYIRDFNRRYPALKKTVWLFLGEQPPVYAAMGKWVVRCACGNAPSVHPDWKIARCFECGAVYQNVQMPEQARAIEEALLKRPIKNRGWLPTESVRQIHQDNAQHGIKESS